MCIGGLPQHYKPRMGPVRIVLLEPGFRVGLELNDQEEYVLINGVQLY